MIYKVQALLVDLTNITYKAYYQMKSRNASVPRPEDVAKYTVTKMLWVMHNYPNAGVITSIDGARPYWREKLIPSRTYKAHRKYDSIDTSTCLDSLDELVSILIKLAIPVIGQEHIESDDFAAGMAYMLGYHRCAIYGNDRDFYQVAALGSFVVTDRVTISPKTKEPVKHIPLNGFLLFRSLCGDSSDNLKGVAGVGPSTATSIIGELVERGKLDHPVINPYEAADILRELFSDPSVIGLKPRSGIMKFLGDLEGSLKSVIMSMRAMRLPHPMCPLDYRHSISTCKAVSGVDIDQRTLHEIFYACVDSGLIRNVAGSLPRRQKKLNRFLLEAIG